MQALVLDITPGRWLRARAVRAVRGVGACWGRLGVLGERAVEPPALPGEDWVVCRTRLGGICGTDLSLVTLSQRPDTILQAFGSMPMIPGHENVAEVVEVGPAVDKSWLGKRVCVEPTLCCAVRGIEPPCRPCASGAFGACENFGAAGQGRYSLPAGTSIGYNARTGGSWGERFVAHVSQLVEPPAGISDEQAVLTDPLACSLHGVLRADFSAARRVFVYGGGILGLGVVACLRAVGYAGEIDLLARHQFQADIATRLGAEVLDARADVLTHAARRTGGQIVNARFGARMLMGGYDVVFDCVGSPAGVGESLKLAAARGQVVLLGTAGAGPIDLTPIWFRELDVIGVYGRQQEHFTGREIGTYQLVHELLTAGKLPTDGLLTHTFALGDYRRAFDAATDKRHSQVVRVAFDFR